MPSTNIQQVRSLIQDYPLYQSDTVVANGADKVVQVTYFPVVGTTVTITPSASLPAFTVDEQNGVITFATAPTAGTYVFTYKHVMLLDATIQDFFDIEEANKSADGSDADIDPRLVAADSLDCIAASQTLILKKIKLLDLDTDGPAVAKELRANAQMMRKLVFDSTYDEPTFDFAEQINDAAGWREKVIKDWERQQ